MTESGENTYAFAKDQAASIGKKSKLCERGYFITDAEEMIPFDYFPGWNCVKILDYYFWTHPNQSLFYEMDEACAYFLIGHGYNPFSKTFWEPLILKELISAGRLGQDAYFEYINSITGVFLLGRLDAEGISVLLDCAGMMGGFYGTIQGRTVITSHTAIVSLLFKLKPSDYVQKLLQYRFYPLYGSYLPGDLSPYEQLKRIVPNTVVSIGHRKQDIRIERFFPACRLEPAETEEAYNAQIAKISDILRSTAELISKKWNCPAISATGGMDSKTTLASAKDVSGRFRYFSYVTSEAERIDADAAHVICGSLGLDHRIYEISADPQDYSEYGAVKEIVRFNKDFIGSPKPSDICKRIYLDKNDDFDVEVKSWVSEIARANYCKKFGKKKMPRRITPRRCSSMYKIFLHKRRLLYETDAVFQEYIEKTKLNERLYNYDWSDLFLWEIRYGGWGGLAITGEHIYAYDITVPYNNRKLLQLMLAVPLEKRRTDTLHKDLIAYMNSDVDAPGITVRNLNETKVREICEKWYFNINTWLPF